jgi:hypothetical protein
MKITDLVESVDFATLYTKKLFSKLKSHELSRKRRPNHDTSLTSKAIITSAHVGGYNANPTNTTVSYVLEFALSSLALLVRKFCALHNSTRKGGDHLGAASSAETSPTSSSTVPRGRSLTPPTSTTITTTIEMTPVTRATTRRSTSSGTRIRSSRRSCPEHVLP